MTPLPARADTRARASSAARSASSSSHAASARAARTGAIRCNVPERSASASAWSSASHTPGSPRRARSRPSASSAMVRPIVAAASDLQDRECGFRGLAPAALVQMRVGLPGQRIQAGVIEVAFGRELDAPRPDSGRRDRTDTPRPVPSRGCRAHWRSGLDPGLACHGEACSRYAQPRVSSPRQDQRGPDRVQRRRRSVSLVARTFRPARAPFRPRRSPRRCPAAASAAPPACGTRAQARRLAATARASQSPRD